MLNQSPQPETKEEQPSSKLLPIPPTCPMGYCTKCGDLTGMWVESNGYREYLCYRPCYLARQAIRAGGGSVEVDAWIREERRRLGGALHHERVQMGLQMRLAIATRKAREAGWRP